MPTPAPDEVVLRVRAVAINPADNAVQSLGIIFPDDAYPLVGGCDVAGEMVQCGADVDDRLAIGDRVIATVRSGAFQLYCPAKIRTVAKLPDQFRFTEGVVLPLGLVTAAVSLYEPENLALPLPKVVPEPENRTFLVWGGASSVGSCAVQLAKASGFIVATTASQRNFDHCKSLGADFVFDYKDENVAQKLIAALNERRGECAGAFNAIFDDDAVRVCAQVVGSLPGNNRTVHTVHPPVFAQKIDSISDGVRISSHTRSLDTVTASYIFREWLAPALANGTMNCLPAPRSVGNGLDDIQGAMDLLAKGASAEKIVVEIS